LVKNFEQNAIYLISLQYYPLTTAVETVQSADEPFGIVAVPLAFALIAPVGNWFAGRSANDSERSIIRN
jgi:hypothetical protein